MKKLLRYTSICLLAVALAPACEYREAGGGGTPPATGTWAGPTTIALGGTRIITLTLEEHGQDISGSCEIADKAGNSYWSGTVSGTHVHPDLSLVLTAAGFDRVSLSGSFEDSNTVRATIDGSGFDSNLVVLKRE
jgi:hypothetical protein